MRIIVKNLAFILLLCISCTSAVSAAVEKSPDLKHAIPETFPPGYVAHLKKHTAEEIEAVLKRAEVYLDDAEKFPNFEPIAFILHGPEVRVFDRKNYEMYKSIVSLAARLEAFNVIDIQICEAQMARDGLEIGDLPAFVNSVPFGPAEEKKLLKRGYQYF